MIGGLAIETAARSGPRRATRPAALALLAAALLASSPAVAQPARDEAVVRAEALYDEAIALMSKGRDAEACPKLEASHAIDPATGTLLALARCLEKTGRIASAWTTYVDAEAWARRHGQADREAAARERAAVLLPRLPRLTIALAPDVAQVPGLALVRNGRPVDLALAGSAVPVDPGDHVIEARAPGRRAVRIELRIAEAEQRSALVEGLVPEVTEDTASPLGPADDARGGGDEGDDGGLTPLQIGGLATGGAGVVALGVGTIFGLVAASANDDSEALCAPFADGRGGTADAYAECTGARDDAASAADVSTVLFVAGGALIAAGVGLVLLGGGDDGAPETAALTVAAAPGGLVARGSF